MHEQSVTVEEDGKWVNKYGPESGARAGAPLPGQSTFDTEREAVSAAVARSNSFKPDEPQYQGPLTQQQLEDKQHSFHEAGHGVGE